MSSIRKSMRVIDYKTAITFLIDKHYSGRKPQIKYAFGLYEDDVLVAVCTYGVPASRSLCVGIMGLDYYDKVIELNRLCRVECGTCLSEFVSYTLRHLKQYNLLIVSYADTAMRHTGAIYQACNFLYTGKTVARTDKYTAGNKHSRHYTDDNKHLRKVRSAKHRYIYYACNRVTRKIYSKALRYPIGTYPKGDKVDYVLGTVLQPVVIDLNDKAKGGGR